MPNDAVVYKIVNPATCLLYLYQLCKAKPMTNPLTVTSHNLVAN